MRQKVHSNLSQNLEENALSFKKEAINHFRIAESGYYNEALKFSIIFAFQSFELMLKHYVSRIHPMLIYKKVFSEHIRRQVAEYTAKTISFEEALNFYNNTFLGNDNEGGGGLFPLDDLKWLQANRNQIMHSHFSLNLIEAYEVLERVLKLSIRLYEKKKQIIIDEQLSNDLKRLKDNLKQNSIYQNDNSKSQIETPKKNMSP